ncbi:MAG TPA: FkbM family methyltransferase [Candidatus Limnocylindrales bacterium]|nr:FkbM family methyltransferase [Candidatus Limnocylindrales bacterium]
MHLKATASRAATLLARNPSLFCRLMIAKINTARRMPPLPVSRTINNIVFEYDLEDYRGTAPMYFGSYALLVIDAMKRVLKSGDVFFDVGANVGYLSAIAAGIVGSRGEVHAFEPVPEYFRRLQRLAQRNSSYRIVPIESAAGETAGNCKIYVTREPGQNTLVPAYKSGPEIVDVLQVRVIRLDEYIEANRIRRIALIKIDAEGYELPVLRGLERHFAKQGNRPPIICEIAPRAYPLMGRKISELTEYLGQFGYSARDLVDGVTPVDLGAVEHVEDVLFVSEATA